MTAGDRLALAQVQRLRTLTWATLAGMVWVSAITASAMLVERSDWPTFASGTSAVLVGALIATWVFARAHVWSEAEQNHLQRRVVSVVASVASLLTAWTLAPVISWWSIVAGLIFTPVAVTAPPRTWAVTVFAGAILIACLGGYRAGVVASAGGTSVAWEVGRAALLVVVAFSLATRTQMWVLRLAEQLDEARRKSAELAVTSERLRFAAELHDIQGHHLQVIALKAELAGRLAAAGSAAAAQMAEVQHLARQALSDTRAVVRGYRSVTLDQEIANASRVLTSAGIDCRVALSTRTIAGRVGNGASGLLALVVREATTNILRHSDASRARIDLRMEGESVRLAILNDGVSGEPSDPSGSGIAGLAERIHAAGGTLDTSQEGTGFRLVATVPARVETGERP